MSKRLPKRELTRKDVQRVIEDNNALTALQNLGMQKELDRLTDSRKVICYQ